MKIIEIPVSRFSKRYLESEYALFTLDAGNPVIRLSKDSLLYRCLCSHTKNIHRYRASTQHLLTDIVTIEVQDGMAQQINRNRLYLGYFLNELHREELYKTLWKTPHLLHGSGIEKEPEVKKLIESWCSFHNIELDVDINYDTIRRGLTRYVAKKTEIYQKQAYNNPSRVHEKHPKKYRYGVEQLPKLYTHDELNRIADAYIRENTGLFKFKTTQAPHQNRMEELKIYIYYYIGGYTTQYIAKILKKNVEFCRKKRRHFCLRLRTFPPIL